MRQDAGPVRLDLDSWPRRQHYELFRAYDNPWFNLCADVDVTAMHAWCGEERGRSFFGASLWCSLAAANEIEEFRYRIRGPEVVVHPLIHGGSTVLLPDGTFRFAYYDYSPDMRRFIEHVGDVTERVRSESGPLDPQDDRDDLIHYSVIPWVPFTSFSHARRWGTEDAVPKIVFGKHRELSGRRMMPVSVEVHHALVDGLHVGRFYEAFQERVDAESPTGA
ncbi:MAG TPA: chloramphenicol acetyltransferase [Gemmatimonadota bacterium]|nr:chloramphenicol acetyltransferase [Gemmatimonadota bacterium]